VPNIVARAASKETVLALLRMGSAQRVLPERHVMFNDRTVTRKLGLSVEAVQAVVAKPIAMREP
jgi:hypothetical protein